MIVLRKPERRILISTVIIADELSGARNASNQVFHTTYDYKRERIQVFYNGQALHSPDDFLETTTSGLLNEVTLVHIKPDSTDELRADYQLANSIADLAADHGLLSGLLDDDHPQYHTDARGDARYYTKPQVNTISGSLQVQIDAKPDNFLELDDTPSIYTGAGGSFVKVNSTATGLEFTTVSGIVDKFTDLSDTPANYAGSQRKYVRVNSAGNGLEFSGLEESGVQSIGNGVTSVSVNFVNSFPDTNYTVTLALENLTDSPPSIYSTLITTKLTTGFTVLFSGDIDSVNYKLNWIAKS